MKYRRVSRSLINHDNKPLARSRIESTKRLERYTQKSKLNVFAGS